MSKKIDDRPIRMVAIDLETSGLDLAGGNVPIEVGAAFRADDGNVQWFQEPIYHAAGSFTWQAEAFKVNGYTLDMISDDAVAQPADLVDARLASWLDTQTGDYRLVPLGLNVGSFDWPFVVKYLPLTARCFLDRYGNLAHQFADLNSMIFLLGAAGSSVNRSSLTRVAEEAAERDRLEVGWHSAGFDAYAAIIGFEYLMRITGLA